MRLSKEVVGVTPVKIYQGNEVGKTITFVGWGDTGSAGVASSSTVSDKKFRVAQNVITSNDKNVIK